MTIERLAGQHVSGVVALHDTELDGLLAQLGPHATRAYYAACASLPSAIGFVAVTDTRVDGFVLGALSHPKLRQAVTLANPLGVAYGVFEGLIRNPSLIRHLLPFGGREGQYDDEAPELIYLAVAPSQRGHGIGASLVTAFSDAMRVAGQSRYELSVDADNPKAAVFYERLGFKRVGEYAEFGRRHVRYVMHLV
jgi:ribosomal protein S18 acetylase RimI-like enzyme